MIDWLIMAFLQLQNLGIINLEQILTINLLIVIICRGFYVIAYVLNYSKDFNKEVKEGKTLFTNNEKITFSLKQIVVILFGILHLPITAFVSFYSLLMAGYYIKQIGVKKTSKVIKVIGIIIYFTSPLFGFLWSFVIDDLFVAIAIGLSLVAFLHYGLKTASLSPSELLKKYENRRINKLRLGNILNIIILIILAGFPTELIIGSAIYAPPERQTYMIEMRDGVNLATDIYFAPGSFGMPRPVVLIRTPYGKTGWAYSIAELLYLTQGYHVVIQDLRGTHDSEGGTTFQLFTKSYQDGVDTIDWIMDRSWCNGKIGSSGASALCLNQYYYAGMAPEGLLCQQLWFGTPEMFDHAIYQGSYHKSSVETWVKSTAPENWEYQRDLIFQYFPKSDNFNSTSLSMPIGPHYSKVSVRAVHIGGFYDHFLQGTIDGYVGYDDYATERARGHQKMVLGPWTHVNFQSQKQGELTYPANANGFDLVTGWEIEVFDESFMEIPADWDGARVAYYLMGDCSTESDKWNYWRYAYDWPLDHVNDTWYFIADGSLDKTTAGLSNEKFTYLFNPRDPVPNLGGQNQPFDLAGPMDQTPIEDRDDVLIFETPVLTEPVETVGRIWGQLYITSNCTDTDFTVKITDVYPDGSSMLICDGSLTTRSRNGYAQGDQELMSGNENDVYELLIDCWSSAYYFASGHKIRITISSSNYPRFAVNPNTGEPLAANYLNYYIAKNSILVGPDYPSGIILPRLINKETTHVIS